MAKKRKKRKKSTSPSDNETFFDVPGRAIYYIGEPNGEQEKRVKNATVRIQKDDGLCHGVELRKDDKDILYPMTEEMLFLMAEAIKKYDENIDDVIEYATLLAEMWDALYVYVRHGDNFIQVAKVPNDLTDREDINAFISQALTMGYAEVVYS